MEVGQIVKGFTNSALRRERDLDLKRIAICKKCKLYKVDGIFGPVCNSGLYLNPKTDETSRTKKIGFIKGCGCNLNAKTRVPEAKCTVDKW